MSKGTKHDKFICWHIQTDLPTTESKSTGLGAALKEFLYSGLAGMCAVTVTHPLDLIKVRMQLQGEGGAKASAGTTLEKAGTFKTAARVIQQEGVFAIYNGYTIVTITPRIEL